MDRKKKYFGSLIAMVCLLFSFLNVTAQEKTITISKDLKWSEKMALSIMKRDPKAWQIDNNENQNGIIS